VEVIMTAAERAALEILGLIGSADLERVRDLVTEDFVDHGAPPGLPPGPDGYIGVLRFLSQVYELRYEVHDVLAVGERVAIRSTAHGVHNHSLLGPPTGRPYAMATMHLYRADGDRLAEHWGVRDEFGVLVQVGAVPPPRLPDELAAPR
jgi:predicted ester cyclase